jgi:DNA-binding transcriptional LysR family regulator
MNRTGLVELDAAAAVARHGNFRAAAADLGISRTALSNAVAGLEGRLGVRLFNRTTRSVRLTEAGEAFIASISPALAQIHSAVESVNSGKDRPAGTLRINASAGAARMVFKPLIPEYLRRYPQMTVDLVVENRLVDIVAQGFDAGIRRADTVPRDMIAVAIGGPLRSLVVASPAFMKDRPTPTTPIDLLAHPCIRVRLPSGELYRWEFEKKGESLALDVRGPLILNEGALIMDAVYAATGFAYASGPEVEADIAAGRLVMVLEDWTPPYDGLCLYYPANRHTPPGLRALVDLIREVGRR